MDPFLAPRFRSDFEAAPLALVDIGASGGLPPHWRVAARHLSVTGFEPDEREFHRLAASAPPGFRYLNTALAETAGPLAFHLARRQMTSSCFAPDLDFLRRFPDHADYEPLKTVKLPAMGLDAARAEAAAAPGGEGDGSRADDPDFVKLDIQGSELAVLRGGDATVRGPAAGLEIEVEFGPVYAGQPLFADIDAHVRARGFQLFDLRPFRWKRTIGLRAGGPRGQIAFADALYFKTPAALSAALTARPGDDTAERRRKLLRALAAVAVYGYADYVLELAAETGGPATPQNPNGLGLLDAEDQTALRAAAHSTRTPMAWLPDFRGRWRLSRLLRAWSDALDPGNRSFSTGEWTLGNRR